MEKTNSLNLYYGWGIFLLIMVLWKGKVVNNAQSWIFGIQPAEFLKLGTILVTARFFALRQEQAKNNWSGIGKLLFFLATIFFLSLNNQI